MLPKHLADIGAASLDDYLAGHPQPSRAPPTAGEPADSNAVTQLHQACQRAFRNTDLLKFEFIEHSPRSKRCILSITKPDGVQRSYTTQPIFAKKNEAKLEAARIAIEMGALEFLAGEIADNHIDPTSVHSNPSFVDDIERYCLEWRAARVAPHWVPFSDPKSVYKQGCALRIQLSPHVVAVYLADPTFDTYLDAKAACAKLAISEGVLDFIKHGNGQTRPSSPIQPSPSLVPLSVTVTSPWTLQAFYQSLPRPFPEFFDTNEASDINAPGWLNTMIQNARGGKLVLSFFFTSDGSPGLHGCLLKLDRPGEYKASLVDARFPKRSDAKAAVCLQAMSDGIGNYIRSIASAVDAKVTQKMRSFSSSVVYPTLMSELSKISTDLHPHFEYDKERDAFGASLVIGLSSSRTPDQVRRYTVPNDYRNKADAKVGVICHAAEQGVVEFVRFRGATPPDGYVSPYTLHNYNPEAPRKRKQPAEDAEQGRPPRKKKKKGKRRADAPSQSEGSQLTPLGQYLSVHASSDQMHGISGPGDMGLSQSVPVDDLCDPSQPGVGGGGGSGAAPSAMYGHGRLFDAPMYVPSYPTVLDPRFVGKGGLDGRAYGPRGLSDAYGGGSRPPRAVAPSDGELPRAMSPGPSGALHPPEPTELEPGEVVSSASSDFSESSSRNEDVKIPAANERAAEVKRSEVKRESVDVEHVALGSKDKAMAKELSPANTSTTVSRDGLSDSISTNATSHVKGLIDYCARHRCGTPLFHHTQNQGRFQVWIVIGKERFDLPTTYGSAEEGRQRVAKQVLARLSKGSSG